MKKLSPLRFVIGYAKKHIPWIAAMGLISCVSALAMIGMALASSRVIDLALTEPRGFTFWFVILLALLAVVAVCNVISSNIRIRATARMRNEMRQGLFGSLLAKEYTAVSGLHSGEILNRFTSDIRIVVEGAVNLLPQIISLGTKLVVGLGVLFFLDWKFTLIVLAGGFLIAACVQLFSRFYRNLHKECQRTEGQTRSFLQECVENMMMIKSFINERGVRKKLDEYQYENYKVQVRRNFFGNIGNTLIYVGFTIGYYGGLAWGALLIANELMTIGTFTAFLQIIEQIRSPFRNVSGLVPQYYAMLASAERLQELTMLPDEESQPLPAPLPTLFDASRGIELSHVSFRYERDVVLRDLSAFFEKEKLTALVGASGSGKTTLIKLLLGLVKPESGDICLSSDQESVPIGPATRGLFAFVPQGNMLLSGTIAENVTFGCESPSKEEIAAAIHLAELDAVIASLPDGLDTVIGERGIGLSEGQIQRVAIARALLSHAPVLLLDECTSALDADTERAVLQNLRSLTSRTVIFISHRPAVLDMADAVVSLENGEAHS
ncbi:MAG: ABC transporter ATP-binding protein [Clostridia bacterium]|nr:ABC transporter ATP-binding protein [Clostridia bacterium]